MLITQNVKTKNQSYGVRFDELYINVLKEDQNFVFCFLEFGLLIRRIYYVY